MRVEIRPAGLPLLAYEIEPTFTSASPGGYKDARLVIPDAEKWADRLLDAKVRIYDTQGPCWMGDVWKVEGTDVTCAGAQARLGLQSADLFYCHTDLTEWRERTNADRQTRINLQADDTNLRAIYEKKTAYDDNDANGWTLRLPVATDAPRVTCHWTRADTNYDMGIWSGVDIASPTCGALYTWTNQWFQGGGSGATSGSVDVTFSGTGANAVLLQTQKYGDATPTANKTMTFDTVKVYGVSGVATTCGATLTATDVVTHAAAQLSTTDLPSGCTDWIGTESTELAYTSGGMKTYLEAVTGVLDYVDWDFRFEAQEYEGDWWPVPVFEQLSTTPDYVAYADDVTVVPNLTGLDMEPLASVVRVQYRTVAGVERYVDVTDSDTTHYLVAAGRTKMAVINADVSSCASASAVGTAYLTEAARAQVAGTVHITAPVRTPSGLPVPPTRILPGKMLRIIGGQAGSLDARITQVSCNGETSADVTLDNTPDLARTVAAAIRANAKA